MPARAIPLQDAHAGLPIDSGVRHEGVVEGHHIVEPTGANIQCRSAR